MEVNEYHDEEHQDKDNEAKEGPDKQDQPP